MAGIVVVGPPASATGTMAAPPAGYGGPVATCGGNRVRTQLLVSSGGATSGSFMDVNYSTADGGTFCAKVFDNISGSHYTSVSVRRGDWQTSWYDTGTYSTYAGGIQVFGASGKCVFFYGLVAVNGVTYETRFGLTGSTTAPVCWLP